jgi:hypothetical protein
VLYLKVEAKFDNVNWTDISSDVMLPIYCSSGITSNTVQDRVADVGKCTFQLKNNVSNSAHLNGYYSPGHINCKSGFAAGLKIRVSFTFLDKTTTKWYGTVAADGIDVDSGIYGERRTRVTAYDYMYLLTMHPMYLMQYATNVRGDQVLPLIIANMPYAPVSTSYAVGQDTFATGLDKLTTDTMAIGEIQKVTMSELGYCYLTHNSVTDECLVWQDRNARNNTITLSSIAIPPSFNAYFLNNTGGHLINDTGGALLLAETSTISLTDQMISLGYSHGANLANRISISFHPKKIDPAATSVLFNLNSPIAISAGATITNYRVSYKDPTGAATRTCGKDMVTPVATTDYLCNTLANGSGTDLTASLTVTVTYGVESALYTFYNASASSGFITFLQARGKGIYDYDVVTKIFEDTALQALYGVHNLSIDLVYQNDATKADLFGLVILGQYKTPISEIKWVSFYTKNDDFTQIFLNADCGYRVNLTETQTAMNEDYFINGWEFTVDGYNATQGAVVNYKWFVKRAALDAQIFARWDVNNWDGAQGWGF